MDILPEDARTALAPVLDPTEHVVRIATAVGCTLVLTEHHLLLVRDGVQYRPRSGIRSWPLERGLTVRLSPRGNTGRLVIEFDHATASVFLMPGQMESIRALVAEARERIFSDT